MWVNVTGASGSIGDSQVGVELVLLDRLLVLLLPEGRIKGISPTPIFVSSMTTPNIKSDENSSGLC